MTESHLVQLEIHVLGDSEKDGTDAVAWFNKRTHVKVSHLNSDGFITEHYTLDYENDVHKALYWQPSYTVIYVVRVTYVSHFYCSHLLFSLNRLDIFLLSQQNMVMS